ncbi:MAG: IS66 family transposase [Planctomycetes bacterium]|nr:IS66 family transposase [Planctomycetota bacterium]
MLLIAKFLQQSRASQDQGLCEDDRPGQLAGGSGCARGPGADAGRGAASEGRGDRGAQASPGALLPARVQLACGAGGPGAARAGVPRDGGGSGGLPGPGLLAHVLVSKFDDHLPWHRQEHIFKRYGLMIPRSTQSHWTTFLADLIEPLVREMAREILQSAVIHTDDTTVRVLDEAYKKTTRTGRLWAYLGDEEHPYTVLDYTPTRGKKWPEAFLGDWRGYLQADAYAGYDAMFTLDGMVEVACWAHARRKFIHAQGTDAARAAVPLAYIKRLYKAEREARDIAALLEHQGAPPEGHVALSINLGHPGPC